jgi:hypothetical protein
MRNTRATIGTISTSSANSSAANRSVASVRKSGTVSTAATLEIAVIVIESAVLPRARCVSRLAIVPPGEAPSRTSPTAKAAASP